MENPPINSKVCLKCKNEKDLNEFSKSRSGKFGVHNWCKICVRVYAKQKYEDNKENRKLEIVRWNQEHPAQTKKYQQVFWDKKSKEQGKERKRYKGYKNRKSKNDKIETIIRPPERLTPKILDF